LQGGGDSGMKNAVSFTCKFHVPGLFLYQEF